MQQHCMDSAAPSPLRPILQRVGFIWYRSFFVADIVFGYVKLGRLPWDSIDLSSAPTLRFYNIVGRRRCFL
jgi:hypothetical protein